MVKNHCSITYSYFVLLPFKIYNLWMYFLGLKVLLFVNRSTFLKRISRTIFGYLNLLSLNNKMQNFVRSLKVYSAWVFSHHFFISRMILCIKHKINFVLCLPLLSWKFRRVSNNLNDVSIEERINLFFLYGYIHVKKFSITLWTYACEKGFA